MGKHRFRLSDMLPNAWFYKLKDMNKPHRPLPIPTTKLKTQKPPPPPPNQQCQIKQAPPLIPNRASYYFPSNSPAPSRSPRMSSTARPRRKLPTAAAAAPRLLLSVSSASARPSVSESESDVRNSNCICAAAAAAAAPPPPKLDVVLDLVGSELDLRPILTRPPPAAAAAAAAKPKKQEDTPKRSKPPSAGSPGRRVRVARRPSGGRRGRGVGGRGRGRAPLEESFAVVKSSSDPRRDFRESMVEMILENRLTASGDLEDLLACYLALNSDEYHDLIVNVFEEIWSDFPQLRHQLIN